MKNKTVIFITKNHTNPAYGGALVGARKITEAAGYVVEMRAPQVPDDPAEQAEIVRQAIAEEPAGIILLPAHATLLNDAIREIEAADIPLVLVVSKPTSGRWICWVGSDNVDLTFRLGCFLLDRLDAASKVAIIDGHPGSITTPERHEGFSAACKSKNVTVVDAVSGYFQHKEGRAAFDEFVGRHGSPDALLVANDLMAMGICEAFDEGHPVVPMVSVNGTPDAVAAIKTGQLVATACLNTLGFGAVAAEALVRHLRGEAVPNEIVLEAEIIHAGNVAEWDQPYELRPMPAWPESPSRHDGSRQFHDKS